ncbi:hypothetical protein DNI29_04645 [Hymenobacter sediminis]|uniref:hypothetical protein n=1 Tax=Hymenobacter sediminis TaxID=2218621 RepID=UPI000DA66594|nr:hypothetical protein [Hymenobacter sediminis]RPD50090.1 hypothetical protein DNI29_04645 [Hymenobacter sediminis]
MNIKSFSNLCQEHRVWIIEYVPYSHEKSVFVVWYTDFEDDDNDKLLVYNDEKIFGTSNIKSMYEMVLKEQQNLAVSTQISNWLQCFGEIMPKADVCFDANSIIGSILNSELNTCKLDELVKIINFYEDYIYQIGIEYDREENVKEIWNYYYDVIFWPRFNSNNKIDLVDQFPLQTDQEALGRAMLSMVRFFEQRIVVVD